MFKRITDSNSNEGMNATNEKDNTNSLKNPRSKINRTNMAASRSAAEEKNERTFILRMTGASPIRTGVEKEKRKFFSRLPIRTWKRLRTKEPAALHLESDVTNGNDNRKLENIAITKSNDHLEEIKDDKVRKKIRAVHATANHIDIKRSNRFEIGSLSADKPKITSSNVKNIKRLKDFRTKGTTSEQRKKRMNNE